MEGRARVVYGSRTINEHCRKHRRYTNPFWRGGRFLTIFANIIFLPFSLEMNAGTRKTTAKTKTTKIPNIERTIFLPLFFLQ